MLAQTKSETTKFSHVSIERSTMEFVLETVTINFWRLETHNFAKTVPTFSVKQNTYLVMIFVVGWATSVTLMSLQDMLQDWDSASQRPEPLMASRHLPSSS